MNGLVEEEREAAGDNIAYGLGKPVSSLSNEPLLSDIKTF